VQVAAQAVLVARVPNAVVDSQQTVLGPQF